MSLSNLRLRKRNSMNNPPRQFMNAFSESVSVHVTNIANFPLFPKICLFSNSFLYPHLLPIPQPIPKFRFQPFSCGTAAGIYDLRRLQIGRYTELNGAARSAPDCCPKASSPARLPSGCSYSPSAKTGVGAKSAKNAPTPHRCEEG